MPSEVDLSGIPRRGSALHIAYYVNCEPQTLSAAILGSDSAGSIDWRSPKADRRFSEYHDREFLAAVGHEDLAEELVKWWPMSGPRWDALGVVAETGAIILVESKANVPEIANGPACGSGSTGSHQGKVNRQQIEKALAVTREHFGIPHEAGTAWLETHCYQYANRLAHLCFFERNSIPAHLAHIYFTGDSTHIPTRTEDFEAQRRADAEAMGLSAVHIESATAAYLPAHEDAYADLRDFVAAQRAA
jgi:hypothetical protein